jgi:predicted enzyme related to lactoylglutathione lyase
MKHLVNWVEIPTTNLERAKKFYNTILDGVQFTDMNIGDIDYALFPAEDKFNCGALVQGGYYRPHPAGVVIYLDGGEDMSHILDKVRAAGGELITPKTYVNGHAGFIGIFIDSEGNKIGLQHL